jgi:hypothetical protein
MAKFIRASCDENSDICLWDLRDARYTVKSIYEEMMRKGVTDLNKWIDDDEIYFQLCEFDGDLYPEFIM